MKKFVRDRCRSILNNSGQRALTPAVVRPAGFFAVVNLEVPASSNPNAQLVPIWSSPGLILSSLAGWLVTAFATLFGAPFWFDVLQGFVRLKGSGPSPAEKANGSAASS